MVSPPSGYHDTVELVKIETSDFSLVIKGKAYHEKYDSLKAYQAMHFHDTMTFIVNGENILDVKVYNVASEQQESTYTGLRPIFFENGVYQLIIDPNTNKDLTFYHEHPGLRQSITPVELNDRKLLMGNLHFQNEIGFSTFEVRSNNKILLSVTIEIFPVKLDYKNDYRKLLQEVSEEIYNLAFQLIRKTYLKTKINLEGDPSPVEFFRLIEYHFNHFIYAINRIEKQPHHQLETIYEKARGDQLGKQDNWSRKYLQKRPHLFIEVNEGIKIKDKKMLPIAGLRIRKKLTYDTLENRYIKWMITRLIHKLTNLLERIYAEKRQWNEDVNENLVRTVSKMRDQLQKRLEKPFWKKVGQLDRSIMSLVMQMAPGYRDAFQIYLTVSKGLALEGNIYRMSVKDVAVLYEYWTFLKIGQILASKYELVSQDIVQVSRDGLYVNLLGNKKAKRVFRHPITKEKIELIYQHTHRNLPTTSQIPDSMLRIKKKGKDYTFDYIFDAKYRIDYAQEGSTYQLKYKTPGPLEEDINTMHRYRDAIVANYNGPYERTAFGAYVLFPWYDEYSYQEHQFYKSIDKVNIGGLPFLPNATILVEKLIERLIDKSAEELQKEGILPRGTLEDWISVLDEKVLVGLVSSHHDYYNYIRRNYYSIETKYLRKNWQEANYVALYLKQGISNTENGITLYGRINEVTIQNNTVYFHIDHWKNLKNVIKPVNYGIATYIMTTLKMLQEATELPELFMKSTDEMILWRILRRVSDQIKVELDQPIIDQAQTIKTYRFNNILIKINRQQNELLFMNNQISKSVPLDLLKKKPTNVFKELVSIMQA